ncbi:hypothetical protein ACE1TI_04270 [Alteribacillus sp. JSM 102045]|uniref:hypothetical protein n=1 Tax=Alteribacillus sp. JSM 102045 TaxID=1562101 RepID=UPI0035BFB532
MAPNLPDFKEYRKRKQQKADSDLRNLLQSYHKWLAVNTNLREKVRAKHLFSQKTGCLMLELEEVPWKLYFEDWFAFDYITIIGTRLFDMFVKEKAEQLSPAEKQLSGLILTAALEPYQLIEKEEGALVAKSWLKKEKIELTMGPAASASLHFSASHFLARFIRCGFENRIISPVIPLRLLHKDQAENWRKTVQGKEEEHQRLRFLKENGVRLIAYADDKEY